MTAQEKVRIAARVLRELGMPADICSTLLMAKCIDDLSEAEQKELREEG